MGSTPRQHPQWNYEGHERRSHHHRRQPTARHHNVQCPNRIGVICERISQPADDKITSNFESVKEILNPGRWPHPEIPLRQMLWILTVVCLQFMGDYWLRHVSPDYTEEFSQKTDEGIHQLVETTIGMNTASWTEFARERLRLPIRMKGCGLREAVDRRYGQYLGAMLQSTMPLMDRKTRKA